MVKTLWIVRHAEASNDLEDFERELTSKGVKQASLAGKILSEKVQKIDEIWTSAAIRTLYTSKIIADEIKFNKFSIRSEKALYNASVRVWLDILHRQVQKTSENILFVGHNPYITYLVELLTGETIGSLEVASIACLQAEAEWEHWTEKTAQFVEMLSPENGI